MYFCNYTLTDVVLNLNTIVTCFFFLQRNQNVKYSKTWTFTCSIITSNNILRKIQLDIFLNA